MRPRLMLIILAALLMAGCAHLSVVHLDKNPWALGQENTLAMRYWEFSYTSQLGLASARPFLLNTWLGSDGPLRSSLAVLMLK